MISIPDDLPDNPVLLKQMLFEALNRQQEVALAYQTHIVDLKEHIKLLRRHLTVVSASRCLPIYRESKLSMNCPTTN